MTPRAGDSGAEGERPLVSLQGVVRRFGDLTVLNGVSLAIGEGEFFTLLGPSGSGKTTMLRLISGFDRPDGGRIEINGVDVARTPPHRRDVNTVFQDYALFPHMSVLENIAYGPLSRKVPRAQALEKARTALEMVRLGELGDRRPGQLSGGQRQRVAMARAIVNEPQVLLLDEPLGALDLKLRHQMQFELQRIQRELGITFIYVTHDQEEALAMSDRIAVFDHGRIAQIGTPRELYERPRDRFVAEFVGVSNILFRGGRTVVVRPERIALHGAAPAAEWAERGTVAEATYLGMTTRYVVALDGGQRINAVTLNGGSAACGNVRRGSAVWASWRGEDMVEIQD